VYSIEAVTLVPHEADPLVVRGPRLMLRYATLEDAPRLFELAADPAVTRFFSWGPYTAVEQPEGYINSLPAKRESG
jgi:ribosomal-protein-alanine N-acetyltransferase